MRVFRLSPRKGKKSVSILLVLSFTLSQVTSFPNPAYGVSDGSLESDSHSPQASRPTPESLASLKLPSEIGRVEKIHGDFKGPGVILLQDAHAVGDAQKSIQKLIAHFEREFGLGLVGLEGASGKLKSELFRAFPDRAMLAGLLDEYLSRGELSGAVAAAFSNPGKSKFFGIEDQALYEKDITAFLRALEARPGQLERLKAYKRDLTILKRRYGSKTFQNLERKLDAFEENSLELHEMLGFLERIAPKEVSQKVPAQYPHLAALVEEVRKSGPREKQNRDSEIRKLAAALRAKLQTPEEIREFHRNEQGYQTERASPEAFGHYLLTQARLKNIRGGLAESLEESSARQELLLQMKGPEFFREFEGYVRDVKAALYASPEERILESLGRDLKLFRKLAELKLSREEWRSLAAAPEGLTLQPGPFSAREDLAEMQAAFQKEGILWRENYKPQRVFYETAQAREEVFARRILERMKTEKTRLALAVMGGFHREGVGGIFESLGVSYAVVMPAIHQVPEDDRYWDFMRGDVSWKSYFRVRNGRIDLYDAFARAVLDRLLARMKVSISEEALRAEIKLWRDQVVRAFALQGNAAKAGGDVRLLDGLLLASLDPARREELEEEWKKRVGDFLARLRELKDKNLLNADALTRLTREPAAAAWTSVPYGSAPESWLVPASKKETAVSKPEFQPEAETVRSEVRTAEPPGPEIPSVEVLTADIRAALYEKPGLAPNWKIFVEEMSFRLIPDQLAEALSQALREGYSFSAFSDTVHDLMLEANQDYSTAEPIRVITTPIAKIIHDHVALRYLPPASQAPERARSEVRQTWIEEAGLERLQNVTVLSRQMEMGLHAGLLDYIAREHGEKEADLAAQATLTGGLGALMHDLFPSWKANGVDVIGMHPIYETIKEHPKRELALGGNIREAILGTGGQIAASFEIELDLKTVFRMRAQSSRARDILDKKILVRVFRTETKQYGAPQYYFDAYYLKNEKLEDTDANDANRVRVFDEVYPDDRPWRDVHMAVYQQATDKLAAFLQSKSAPAKFRVKKDLLYVDNEVFVSLPHTKRAAQKSEPLRMHINHTVFRPGMYEPDEAAYELLGFPEWMRPYIVKDGKVSIADYVALSYDLFVGVSLYEHTPVLKTIFPAATHKLTGWRDQAGLRSTNAVLLEHWQAPERRQLIDEYRVKLRLPANATDQDFFDAIRAHVLFDEFKRKSEFVSAMDTAQLLLWLDHKQDPEQRFRWLEKTFEKWMAAAYPDEASRPEFDAREEFQNFHDRVREAVFETHEGKRERLWRNLAKQYGALREALMEDPIISNVRRQVPYKGPDKWIEVLEGLARDPGKLEYFKQHAGRIVIGGRIFDGKYDTQGRLVDGALFKFQRIQELVRQLGLENHLMTVEDYNIREADMIFRGVAGVVMLSDEFLEASATSPGKGIPNFGAPIGVWGGFMPELFKIVEKESRRVIDIFAEGVSYEQVESNLRSGAWQIPNGFLVEYSPEKSNQAGGGRRPSAPSLEASLYWIKQAYANQESRRDLQFEVLATSPKVNMRESQARAHANLWEEALRKREEREKVFKALKFSNADAAALFKTDLPNFEWRLDETRKGESGELGLLGFFEAFRRLMVWGAGDQRGQSARQSLFHHAGRGDIFAYLTSFFANLSGSSRALKEKLEALAAEAAESNDMEARVSLNLEAMDLVDRYLLKLSGQIFEKYLTTTKASERAALERILSNRLVRKNVARYLDDHPGAAVLKTDERGIRAFRLEQEGGPKIVVLNTGAISFPDPEDKNIVKAWGKILPGDAFRAYVESRSEDPQAVFQVQDVKHKTSYGLYNRDSLRTGLPLGIPEPAGIQILEFVPKDAEVLALLSAGTERKSTGIPDAIERIVVRIRSLLESEGAAGLKRYLSQVTSLSKKEARTVFSEPKLPAVMALIAGLVPDLLDDMRPWNPNAHRLLKRVVEEYPDLFREGKIDFPIIREGALIFTRSLGERNVIIPIQFIPDPISHQDPRIGKVWSVVRNLGSATDETNPESSPFKLERDARYQVVDLLLPPSQNTYGTHLGNDLLRHWDVGIPVVDFATGKPLWGFQVLELRKAGPGGEVLRPGVKEPNELQTYQINTRAYFAERGITSFDQITDAMLGEIKAMGFNSLWMMGIWEESPESRRINEYWGGVHGTPGRVASAYSIPDYSVSQLLGGEEAFRRLVTRAKQAGLRMIVDFIPNHLSKDSPLIGEHPGWFIHRDTKPRDQEKDFYFEYRLGPAAGHPQGKTIWVAHGKDTNPWSDTAQLDLSNPEVWQFLLERLLFLADLTQGGGVRADSFQAVHNDTYREKWFPHKSGEAFNREVRAIGVDMFGRSYLNSHQLFELLIDFVEIHYPDFKVLGELYHGQHGEWQKAGVDLTYAKYVYDWIVEGKEGGWLNFKDYIFARGKHTSVTLDSLRHSVYFLEDHDTRKRVLEVLRERLNRPKADAETVAWAKLLMTAIATIPGSPMVHEGQEAGYNKPIASADWVPVSVSPQGEYVEDLKGFFRELLNKTSDPVFRLGGLPREIPIRDNANPEIFAFAREHEGRAGITVFNHTADPVNLKLDLRAAGLGDAELEIQLPAWGTHVEIRPLLPYGPTQAAKAPKKRSEVRTQPDQGPPVSLSMQENLKALREIAKLLPNLRMKEAEAVLLAGEKGSTAKLARMVLNAARSHWESGKLLREAVKPLFGYMILFAFEEYANTPERTPEMHEDIVRMTLDTTGYFLNSAPGQTWFSETELIERASFELDNALASLQRWEDLERTTRSYMEAPQYSAMRRGKAVMVYATLIRSIRYFISPEEIALLHERLGQALALWKSRGTKTFKPEDVTFVGKQLFGAHANTALLKGTPADLDEAENILREAAEKNLWSFESFDTAFRMEALRGMALTRRDPAQAAAKFENARGQISAYFEKDGVDQNEKAQRPYFEAALEFYKGNFERAAELYKELTVSMREKAYYPAALYDYASVLDLLGRKEEARIAYHELFGFFASERAAGKNFTVNPVHDNRPPAPDDSKGQLARMLDFTEAMLRDKAQWPANPGALYEIAQLLIEHGRVDLAKMYPLLWQMAQKSVEQGTLEQDWPHYEAWISAMMASDAAPIWTVLLRSYLYVEPASPLKPKILDYMARRASRLAGNIDGHMEYLLMTRVGNQNRTEAAMKTVEMIDAVVFMANYDEAAKTLRFPFDPIEGLKFLETVNKRLAKKLYVEEAFLPGFFYANALIRLQQYGERMGELGSAAKEEYNRKLKKTLDAKTYANAVRAFREVKNIEVAIFFRVLATTALQVGHDIMFENAMKDLIKSLRLSYSLAQPPGALFIEYGHLLSNFSPYVKRLVKQGRREEARRVIGEWASYLADIVNLLETGGLEPDEAKKGVLEVFSSISGLSASQWTLMVEPEGPMAGTLKRFLRIAGNILPGPRDKPEHLGLASIAGLLGDMDLFTENARLLLQDFSPEGKTAPYLSQAFDIMAGLVHQAALRNDTALYDEARAKAAQLASLYEAMASQSPAGAGAAEDDEADINVPAQKIYLHLVEGEYDKVLQGVAEAREHFAVGKPEAARSFLYHNVLAHALSGNPAAALADLRKALPGVAGETLSKERRLDYESNLDTITLFMAEDHRWRVANLLFRLFFEEGLSLSARKEILSVAGHFHMGGARAVFSDYLKTLGQHPERYQQDRDLPILEWLRDTHPDKADLYYLADSLIRAADTKTPAKPLRKVRDDLKADFRAADFQKLAEMYIADGEYKTALEMIAAGQKAAAKEKSESVYLTTLEKRAAELQKLYEALVKSHEADDYPKTLEITATLLEGGEDLPGLAPTPNAAPVLKIRDSARALIQARESLGAGDWLGALQGLRSMANPDKKIRDAVRSLEDFAKRLDTVGILLTGKAQGIGGAAEGGEEKRFEQAGRELATAFTRFEAYWRFAPSDFDEVRNFSRKIQKLQDEAAEYESAIQGGSLKEALAAAQNLAGFPERKNRAFELVLDRAHKVFEAAFQQTDPRRREAAFQLAFDLGRIPLELTAQHEADPWHLQKAQEVVSQAAAQIWLPELINDYYMIKAMALAEEKREERERRERKLTPKIQLEFAFNQKVEMTPRGFILRGFKKEDLKEISRGDTFRMKPAGTAETLQPIFRVTRVEGDKVFFDLPKSQRGYDYVRDLLEDRLARGGALLRTKNTAWERQREMMEHIIKRIEESARPKLGLERKEPIRLVTTGNLLADGMLGLRIELPPSKDQEEATRKEEGWIRTFLAEKEKRERALDPKFQGLDHEQREGIVRALRSDVPFVFYQGPPGTGKTTAIIWLIEAFLERARQQGIQASFKDLWVLSQTNAGVDNIIIREMERNERAREHGEAETLIVRIGNNEEAVAFPVLDVWSKRAELLDVVVKNRAASKPTVIHATLNGGPTDNEALKRPSLMSGHVAIEDESSRGTVPESLLPLFVIGGLRKLFLVGDPKQLRAHGLGDDEVDSARKELKRAGVSELAGPIISAPHRSAQDIFKPAHLEQFTVSLLERALGIYSAANGLFSVTKPPFYFFDIQRRSGSDLVELVNILYEWRLKAGLSETGEFILDNTEGRYPETKEGFNEEHTVNYGEVTRTLQWMNTMIHDKKLELKDIAVTSPYAKQVEHISVAFGKAARIADYLRSVEKGVPLADFSQKELEELLGSSFITDLVYERGIGELKGLGVWRRLDRRERRSRLEQTAARFKKEMRELLTAPDASKAANLRNKMLGLGENFVTSEQIAKGELRVLTVDSSIGSEYKAVILSMVRSNKDGNVGFLANMNRLAVMLSRAQKHFVMIADLETLLNSKDHQVKRVARHIQALDRKIKARSEVRILREAVDPVLETLATTRPLNLGAAERFLGRSELKFEGVVKTFEDRSGRYFPVYAANILGGGRDRDTLSFALEHPDYDARLEAFSAASLAGLETEIADYFSKPGPNGVSPEPLRFAFAMPFSSKPAIRSWWLGFLDKISELSARPEYRDKISANLRILASAEELEKWPKFFARLEKTGMAKVIFTRTPDTAAEINRFLATHTNALLYAPPDETTGRDVSQKDRVVNLAEGLFWEQAFGVSTLISFKAAQLSLINAELLREIPEQMPPGAAGMVVYRGRGLVIQTAARDLVLEAQVARLIASMA